MKTSQRENEKTSAKQTMKPSCKKCRKSKEETKTICSNKSDKSDQSSRLPILTSLTGLSASIVKSAVDARLAGAGVGITTPISVDAPSTISTSSTSSTSSIGSGKYALLLEGPVDTNGVGISGHVTTANKMANLLRTKYGYVVDICNGASNASNNSAGQLQILYQKFMAHVSKPGATGILGYVGHGSQSSLDREQWDFGCISDHQLSTDLGNNIAEGSQVILIDDSCFSDGMIDLPYLCGSHALRGSLAFFSAARSTGPDETRSALFDCDGGVMTTGIFLALDKLSTSSTQLTVSVGEVYKRMLKDLYNTSTTSTGQSTSSLPLYLPLLTIYPTPTTDGLDIDNTGVHF